MNISLIGIDVAKDVFEVRYEDCSGNKVEGGSVRRGRLIEHITKRAKGCRLAMEACGSSHYWAKELTALGFSVVMISPQFVKPYRKSQKNDVNDAEAICIAARQPGMRFVAAKGSEQLLIQALHRSRERFVRDRTALINQTRGLLLEHGLYIERGVSAFKKKVPMILNAGGPEMLIRLLQIHWEHYLHLDGQVMQLTKALEGVFKTNESCRKIANVSGIGPITATALISRVGNPANYKNGRSFAASLGLVPRQYSTGGKTVLGRITKQGDCYVRKLLIHGARAVVRHAPRAKLHTQTSLWVASLVERCGTNRAAVAMANKTARHVWAILAGKKPRESAVAYQLAH